MNEVATAIALSITIVVVLTLACAELRERFPKRLRKKRRISAKEQLRDTLVLYRKSTDSAEPYEASRVKQSGDDGQQG